MISELSHLRTLGRLLTGLLLALLAAGAAAASEPGTPWTLSALAVKPFWRSRTLEGESLLFVRDAAREGAMASMLLEPLKILRVCSSSGAVEYQEGRDYVWKVGSREMRLPAGSRIPSKTVAELRRPSGSQAYRLTHRDGAGEILFGAGHEYHDMQTLVTYRHKAVQWPGVFPEFQHSRLPRSLVRLKAQGPLKIALLGDSISTGCNASGWAGVAPFQPAYQDLLVLNLRRAYRAEVTLTNFAVGGTDTSWGLSRIDAVAASRPDLVLLAFGMNDAAGRPASEYGANVARMLERLGERCPSAEFILISPMVGNSDWTVLKSDLFPQYRQTLTDLCRPSVALADLTSVWLKMLERKRDWDLTGNGVNHPNDFGHRLYAQVLSALLIPPGK